MKMLDYFNFKGLLKLLFIVSFSSVNAQITVSSADQFNALSLSPGDVVVWENGIYSNQQIRFTNGNGTSTNPIILQAETPGGVIFNGESGVEMGSDYAIMDGFTFRGLGKSNYFQLRKGTDYANNSIVRNCAFDDLSIAAGDPETTKHRWVVMYGRNNTVENCSFLNKKSPGAGLLVEVEFNFEEGPGIPVNHVIKNNYFYNITPKDLLSTNKGDSEAIRVGTSEFQTVNTNVLVENNYFVEADGENEIITNKSTNNSYLRNTFRRCRGSLVLRHGANAIVDGNFFLGENKARSGGIRITDSNHIVTNNYMQDLANDGSTFNNGITLMGGSSPSGGLDNGYQYAENLIIAYNTIYNSENPIHYNDSKGRRDPTGVIAHNVVYSERGNLVTGDITQIGDKMSYEGNIFGGAIVGISDQGITIADAQFTASDEIFKPSETGPVANIVTGSNQYLSEVPLDVEGLSRPLNNRDAGAFEVSGGTGIAIYKPITDADVSKTIGACFLDSAGQLLTTCAGVVVPSLSVTSITEYAATAETKTITVTSNQNWSVTDDQAWISLDVTSGTNNGMVEVTVLENTTFEERTGTVEFTAGSITRRVLVSQAGAIDPNAPEKLVATVSAFTEEEVTPTKNNPASNIYDGDINSTWASQGTESVTLDLGASKEITSFRVAAKKARPNFFSIEVSQDGVTFTEVIAPVAITTELILEEYVAPENTNARYIKLIARGRDGNTDDQNFNSFNELEIFGRSAVLSIEEFESEKSGFSFYPNPVKELLNITIENKTIDKIQIYSIGGQEVFSEFLNNSEEVLNLSNLASGLYIAKFSKENKNIVARIIVE